jgi:pimeloyl-ACP methyl ester carboxylesterase
MPLRPPRMEGRLYRVALRAGGASLAACIAFAASPAMAIEAYIFRGAGDFSFIAKPLTFSQGMDHLADKLEASGIRSRVFRWEFAEAAYREIMSRKPSAVALMGHSMGALAAINMAARLRNSGVRVSYLGLIDIPGPVGATPSNVEWAENFYHAFPVYGMLTKGPGHNGIISNNYVFGEIHVTMDNSKTVHNAMISAIWQADAFGKRAIANAYAPERTSASSSQAALEAQ